MNLKVEMILMVIVAFLIGWFLRTMMSGSSIGSGSRVKAVGGKHASSPIWACNDQCEIDCRDPTGKPGDHDINGCNWNCYTDCQNKYRDH